MQRLRSAAGAGTLVLALASGCAQLATEDPATGATESEFDFCTLLDVGQADSIARELDLVQADYGSPQLVFREVLPTEPAAELCRYGGAVDSTWFELVVDPDGWPAGRDLPAGAEPRPDLGDHAYFHDHADTPPRFVLAVPAGPAYLTLTTIVGLSVEEPDRGPDAGQAEQGMRELLADVADRLPAGARLARLAAGEHCSQFADAVAGPLGGSAEFSRQVEVDGAHVCAFSAPATGVRVSISERLDEAEAFASIQETVSDEVAPDAWSLRHIAGLVYYFAGPDLVMLRVSGDDLSEDERNELVELLATEVGPLIAAGQ